MNKRLFIFLFLLGNSALCFSQAVLPTSYGFDAVAPTGWTSNLTGTLTYATGQSGVAARLDATGEYIQVDFAEDPGNISYYVKGSVGGGTTSWSGTFTVQESVDGVVWTILHSYGNGQLNIADFSLITDSPLNSTRHIRFFYTTKLSGANVSLDEITLSTPTLGAAQEINVVQAGNIIPSGITYSLGDATSTIFTIQNLGLSNSLHISYISLGGSNASDYSIVNPPTLIGPNSEADFILNFNPGGLGARYCTITIGNDDETENPYVINIYNVTGNIGGCLDIAACNFNSNASFDDGSCLYPGCIELSACNYNPAAGCDDGSCIVSGCTDPGACNYDASAGCDDGSCIVSGCNDPNACNFDPNASCSDACLYPGCTNPQACNYDVLACTDDGSCIILGAPCDDGNPNTLLDAYHEFCNCYGILNSDACGDEIFISEYVEGYSNNKAIELFNPTNSPINLTGHYSMGRDRDGAGAPMLLPITGIIPARGTRVFVLDRRDPNGTGTEVPVAAELAAVADTFVNPVYVQVNSPFYFTGDDAFVLVKDNSTILDIVGKIGEDPGSGWGTGDGIIWTQDHGMVRKPFVHVGVSINPDVFNPASEWDLIPVNDFSHLGWHSTNCLGGQPIFGCMDTVACNYNPDANVSDQSCLFPGCTDNNACNYNSTAGCDDGSCLYLNASCSDNNQNTMLDAIQSNCLCSGTPFNYGTLGSGNQTICTGANVPNYTVSAPLNLANYTAQWYYRDGAVACPSGNSTASWIAIPNANALAYTPMEFAGTRTFACFISPDLSYGIPAQWANGCKTLSYYGFAAQPIIGNPNITPFTNFNYIVNPISGHTYTWSVTNGAIASGQGTNNVSIMWGQNGPYQVTLTESNGTCSDTSVLFVVNNNCTNTVSAVAENSAGFCPGTTNTLNAVTTASGVTYQWYLDGEAVANATEQSFEISQGGNYQVMITSGTCTSVSQILTVNELPGVVVPDIAVISSNPGCSGGSVTLSAEGASFSNYLWSNGATTSTIEVNSSGDYSVELTNADGCSATAGPVTVNLSLTETLPICLVTVDQQTGNNQVIWEPLTSDVISAYSVYKETNAADVYALVGTVAYGQDGIFTDVNSNSAVQASRYKLAIIDTCSVESSRSPLHKTIHLTSNVGLNNTVNLIWTAYEGFGFASYNIYRGTDINNMTLLTTIASNLTSYTDVSPIGGNAFYVIEVEGISCDPARSAVSSRSNMIQHTASGVEERASQMLRVYPNPATDQITIQCASSLIGQEYVIYNVVGEVVMRGKVYSSAMTLDIASLASGTYAFKSGAVNRLFVKK